MADIKFNTVREVLLDVASEFSERPAFLQKRYKGGEYETITYKQFISDIRAMGAKLLDMGFYGKKIAVMGANCYQWTVAYHAVINGLGVVVPLDRELSKEEVENLIRRSGSEVVFYTEDYEGRFADLDLLCKIRMNQYTDGVNPEESLTWNKLMEEGKALPEEKISEYVDIDIDPEKLAVIMFTSGTTSIPKGVTLCHRNLVYNFLDMHGVLQISHEDRNLSILPNHHCFESVMGTMYILSRGASVAYGEGLKYILKNMKESETTMLLAVPALVETMRNRIHRNAAKAGKERLLEKRIALNKRLKAMGVDISKKLFRFTRDEMGESFRMIFTGAAPIDPKICRDFEDVGIKVLQGYGQTEATALISGTPFSEDTYSKSGSVGPVLEHIKGWIEGADENGIGELVISGPNLMMGYFESPEETAGTIVEDRLYTGDLGFLDKNGWLYITGRKKNMIVTKSGKNIYPEELEILLSRNKYISESLVYGAEDPKTSGAVVSVQVRPDYEIIAEDNGELDDDGVFALIKNEITEINQGLPNYKRIRNVRVRKEEFVKTGSKKIKRQQNI